MSEATKKLLLKSLILAILLGMFVYFYFVEIVIKYLHRLTNTAKSAQFIETMAVPTITICTGMKQTVLKNYNITTMFFVEKPDKDSSTNLPLNSTVKSVFSDITYKLNRGKSLLEMSATTFLPD